MSRSFSHFIPATPPVDFDASPAASAKPPTAPEVSSAAPPPPPAGIERERAAIAGERAAIGRERAAIAGERAAYEQERASSDAAQRVEQDRRDHEREMERAERATERIERETERAERDQDRAERDNDRDERDKERAERDKERAERDKERAERGAGFLAALVESSDDAILATDLDGVIQSWNAAAARLFGYSAAEAVGKPILMITPHEKLEEQAAVFGRVRRGMDVEHFETTRQHRHGARLELSMTVSPVRDRHGRTIGIGIIARDVTGRKRAEEALRRSAQGTRLLQKLGVELVLEEDPRAIYQKLAETAAELMGAQFASVQMFHAERGTAGELELLAYYGFTPRAARFWRWVSADSKSTCGMALSTGRRSIAANVSKCEFMAGSEDLTTYLQAGIHAVQTTPLISRGGKLLGMISTHWDHPHQPDEEELGRFDLLARQAADVIEQKLAEQALRRADQRKDEFLATLAHELRNPLAPILSSIELLRERAGANGEQEAALREAREIIDRQARHLARLVDDLLDVSRINHDKIELRRQRIELAPVIESAVESCRPLLGDLRHQLTLDLPEAPIWLQGDPVRLAQIFGNLLNNACKYTPESGKVHLSARCCGDEVSVAISDTGIGIPRDKLRDIFDMFSQTGRELERKHGGLGIGLHLVKRLIDLHGGSIEARSEGEGRGATFIVRLPVESPAAREAGPRESSMDRIQPGQRMQTMENGSAKSILLVDDNRDAAIALSRMLSLRGHQVQICHGGAEAVELAGRQNFDIILLDIGLPKMSGYDVCRAIRSAPAGDKARIIALTGFGAEQDRQRSTAAGFDAHLVKPIDLELLERTIHARSGMESREKSAVGDREEQGTRNLK